MADLKTYHSGDYIRLQRLLKHHHQFQLILIEHNFAGYVDTLQKKLAEQSLPTHLWEIPAALPSEAFISTLIEQAKQATVLHVTGIGEVLRQHGGKQLFARLNYGREALAEALKTSILLWLNPDELSRFAHQAPDLWAWRTAILDFKLITGTTPVDLKPIENVNIIDKEEKLQRLQVLETYLNDREASHQQITLLLEKVDIHLALGDIPTAEAVANLAGDLAMQFDDRLSNAYAMSRLATIRRIQGQFDEALRIHREEELPVYERLGDVRSIAVTKGQIADILEARGQLDEALRIREEDQLPVYERLGDVRSIAVTKGQIADILEARGQLDEALRIREEDQLPVYERLGDVRSIAVTKGQIADILEARGQLDEALRIREEDQLPVYERLGDVRSIAVTKGQIADILKARGQLDEALRIREEDQLPIYERLGDVRSIAVTKGQIADTLEARGQLDEALRIHREEELPVYERLGDVRSIAITQAKIAMLLIVRAIPGDDSQARQLLLKALATTMKMKLPEAQQITAIMVNSGLFPEGVPEPSLSE